MKTQLVIKSGLKLPQGPKGESYELYEYNTKIVFTDDQGKEDEFWYGKVDSFLHMKENYFDKFNCYHFYFINTERCNDFSFNCLKELRKMKTNSAVPYLRSFMKDEELFAHIVNTEIKQKVDELKEQIVSLEKNIIW